jgi:alanine racemase
MRNHRPSSRPLQVHVDVAALAHNLGRARALAAGRPVWAVVKANAYGHGIENAVRGFAAADGLAVLELDEAERARAAGWRGPILLLEGLFAAQDLPAARALGLTVVLHCMDQLRILELEQTGDGPVLPVFLKIDTGMNRLGFPAAQVAPARARLQALPGVRLQALMSHLANADATATAAATPDSVTHAAAPGSAADSAADHPGACRVLAFAQWQRLRALAPDWPGPWSISNSAGLFLQPAFAGEMVRPGIALYGASPRAGLSASALGLRAAMTLRSRVLAVRDIARGEQVGYGSLWTATRASRIAVIAGGYADGYPRGLPSGTPVWVAGKLAPLAGRVSMDMLMADVSDNPEAVAGAPVELWGARVPVDELAGAAGTVGYELLSGLPARVREAP